MKNSCPDNIALAMAKLDIKAKHVKDFIEWEWETRNWLRKLISKKLTNEQALIILWKAKYGIN